MVAFVKGTRTQPACGFSYRVLTILNEIGADYEVRERGSRWLRGGAGGSANLHMGCSARLHAEQLWQFIEMLHGTRCRAGFGTHIH